MLYTSKASWTHTQTGLIIHHKSPRALASNGRASCLPGTWRASTEQFRLAGARWPLSGRSEVARRVLSKQLAQPLLTERLWGLVVYYLSPDVKGNKTFLCRFSKTWTGKVKLPHTWEEYHSTHIKCHSNILPWKAAVMNSRHSWQGLTYW